MWNFPSILCREVSFAPCGDRLITSTPHFFV